TIHLFFFFNDTATTEIYTLSLHDALPISEVFMRREFHARHDFQELVDFGYGHNCFLRLACGGCVEFSAIQSPPVRLQTPCWPRPGVARPPTGGLCAPPGSAFAHQQFSSAKSCLQSTRTIAPRKGSLFLVNLRHDFRAQ